METLTCLKILKRSNQLHTVATSSTERRRSTWQPPCCWILPWGQLSSQLLWLLWNPKGQSQDHHYFGINSILGNNVSLQKILFKNRRIPKLSIVGQYICPCMSCFWQTEATKPCSFMTNFDAAKGRVVGNADDGDQPDPMLKVSFKEGTKVWRPWHCEVSFRCFSYFDLITLLNLGHLGKTKSCLTSFPPRLPWKARSLSSTNKGSSITM